MSCKLVLVKISLLGETSEGMPYMGFEVTKWMQEESPILIEGFKKKLTQL